MTRTFLPLVILALVASVVAAQVPPPPEQMKKFDGIIGDWVGSGSTALGPDGPEAPWTSKSSARKIMGGHFVRDVVHIHIEGPMEMTLAFVNFYAWNSVEKHFVAYSLSNMGELRSTRIDWTDDHTMTQFAVTERPDQGRFIERWITKVKGDVAHLEGMNAGGTGGLWTMVKGTMKRAKDAKEVTVDGIGAMMIEPSAEMTKLGRMAGTYTVSGSYTMAEGAPATDFAGTEHVAKVFGGLAIVNRPKGDGYEAYNATIWDASKKCFRRFYLNTWGMHGEDESVMIDGKYVLFATQEVMGQRMAQRFVLEFDDKGRLSKGVGHAIAGLGKPFKSFESTYALKNAGKAGGN